MEVRCPAAFARTGCRWVTTTAHSTTPTLTNDRTIVNHRANGLRTAIPFGRETNALTRKCGQRRMRQAVTREGGHAKRNPRLARERVIETRALPYPHTLARRRFRLARKCPAVPIMRCHRQGQAFSVWRDAAQRNGSAVSGSVCSCGLSVGDGHCTFDNPYPDEQPHYRQPQH